MKRHRFDPLSFLLGAVLLVVALTFLLSGNFPVIRLARIWPVAMIGVGLMLGAWALSTALNRTKAEPQPETATTLEHSDPPARDATPLPSDEA